MTLYNVARWSIFASGIVYGFVHNRTLINDAKEFHEEKAIKKQEKLIKEAKAEWFKLHPKPVPTGGPVTDVSSPDFDPVKVIDWQLQQLDKSS